MHHARVKLVYKYSEARLMLQSVSLYKLLGIGGKKGGTSTHPYHIITMVPTIQHASLFTNILWYGLTKAIKLVPSNLMSLGDTQIWISMQPYHITRNAIAQLLVVVVMEDLIDWSVDLSKWSMDICRCGGF